MAQLIPERLPRRATASERRLHAALARLPSDCLVYFEPVVANRYPDFVVIAPSLGVLTIELKGWRREDIVGADSQAVFLREPSRVGGADSVARRMHPVRQARDYMFRLMERCRTHRYAQGLLQTGGPHQGNFCFPFSHVAILANLSVEQLKAHPAGDLTEVFPAQRVLPREALALLEKAGPEEMLSLLAACFDPTWAFPPLTNAQVNALRAIIHPEIVLAPTLPGFASEEKPTDAATGAARAATSELKVLDLQQERHARQIGSGHRLVFGVAGSGKTVILLARARLLADYGACRQVLVLCYNVTFAAGLRAALASCANVSVAHFEGWAKANGVARLRPRGAPLESLESLGRRLHVRLERGEADARRFDAVLIDEAQDFEANWFRCALAAMKDPLEGDLLVVGDGSQGLYRRGKFRWSEVGIQARGRTVSARFELDRNYRNTREIARLAALFAANGPVPTGGGMEEEGVPIMAADPCKCPRSGGQRPVLVRAENRVDECARALKIVEDLRAGKWFGEMIPAPAPEEIGVLYRAVCPAKEKLFRRFLGALGRIAPTVWLTEPGCPQARERVGEKAIKVQTVHSAKGLQYKAVILLWADDLPAAYGDADPEAERRLLYVALTRAEDWLAMTSSNPSVFVEEVQRSEHVTLI